MIRFISSLGESNAECVNAVLHFLSLEHMRLKGQAITWTGWSTREVLDVVKDHNFEDSPLVICCYARRICEEKPCTFDSSALSQVRQQMMKEIKEGKLIELNLPSGKVLPIPPDANKDRGSLLTYKDLRPIPLANALRVFGVENDTGVMSLQFENTVETHIPESTHLEDALKLFDADGGECLGMDTRCETDQVNEVVTLSESETEEATQQEDFRSFTLHEVSRLPPLTVVSTFGQWHITASDVKRLNVEDADAGADEEEFWLNDQIINMYMVLLASASSAATHAFPSQFYSQLVKGGYSTVKKWTHKKREKVDVFSFDLLLVPIHLGRHWALVVVNFRDKAVTYYDSLATRTTIPSNHIINYLSQESIVVGRGELDNAWCHGCACATGVPKQTNSYDCGVFVCAFAKSITQFDDCWTFAQSDMLSIRLTIFNEIMHNKILAQSERCLPLQTLWPAASKPIMPVRYSVPTVKEAFLIQSGRLHQRRDCFPADRRNTQCTAISACAIIAQYILKRPFSALEMDAIVLMGDELYVQCRTGAKEVADRWLSPDDLSEMGTITVFKNKFNLKIEYVSGGTYKDKNRSYAFSDCLQQENGKPAQGYYFVGRSTTVSFWQMPGGSFLLFNSHCVNKDNSVQEFSELGATRLFCCSTPVAVGRLLFRGCPFDHSYWSLVRVNLTTL